MTEQLSMRKLYLIVFLTGAVVMVLELVGSRILAPTLGTSTFVWASIIGVILGAMSLGYYEGGRLADHNPNPKTFSSFIFLSGVCVFLIIIFKGPVSDLGPYLGVELGSLFAATFLFFAPSFLLGMVSPYAVRLSLEGMESSGRTVGNLYAISTCGSIAGTFAAGFYLIPACGSTNLLYGLALSLFAIALFTYHGGRRTAEVVAAALVLGVCSLGAEAAGQGRYLYEADSAYNHIRVYDTEKDGHPLRVMAVENFFDSGMYLDSPELAFSYSRYYALDEAFGGKINQVAIFGGAAYSVPKDFLRRNPTGRIEVVEIDPQTTAVAKKYFNLRDDPRLTTIHEDARIFLNDQVKRASGIYDAIYNDAFSSACAIPAHLTTVEALREVSGLLDDDGVYIVNTISSLRGEKSTFFRAEYKTLSQVFPGVYVFPTQPAGYSPDETQNIMLLATKKKQDLPAIKARFSGDQEMTKLLDDRWLPGVDTGDVATLTDDFSPVSNYAAAVCRVR